MVRLIPILFTLLALAGLGTDKQMFHTPPDDAAAYHAHVRAVAAGIPLQFGSWFGTDCEVPQAALKMLHPNVVISRAYDNISTGQRVSFLLVHVKDIRDILGHYPPYCYPGRGWTMLEHKPCDWSIGGVPLRGTQYTFSSSKLDARAELVVDNLILLPDGKTYPDMDAAEDAAQDHRRKFFGAAQIQLVYEADLSAKQQDEIRRSLLTTNLPAIRAICFGAGVDEAQVTHAN